MLVICLEKCKILHTIRVYGLMIFYRFFKGDGWEQNLDLATDYYKLAANENYEPAIGRLEEIRVIEEEKKRLMEKAAARKGWKFWSMFGNRKKMVN